MRTVNTGDADHVQFPRLGTTYLIRSEDTEGRFALLEHQIPARALAAPVHVHQNEDEYSLVTSGRVGIQVGDETAEAGPGELVFKPRRIPHAFWNPGDEEARLIELISPGGFERYFEEIAPMLNVEGPPDFEKLAAIQARYGLEMDPETIGPLTEKHGLRA
jgi:mannose-6-phosphate isomerase-like protein (cupin superfamily)